MDGFELDSGCYAQPRPDDKAYAACDLDGQTQKCIRVFAKSPPRPYARKAEFALVQYQSRSEITRDSYYTPKLGDAGYSVEMTKKQNVITDVVRRGIPSDPAEVRLAGTDGPNGMQANGIDLLGRFTTRTRQTGMQHERLQLMTQQKHQREEHRIKKCEPIAAYNCAHNRCTQSLWWCVMSCTASQHQVALGTATDASAEVLRVNNGAASIGNVGKIGTANRHTPGKDAH